MQFKQKGKSLDWFCLSSVLYNIAHTHIFTCITDYRYMTNEYTWQIQICDKYKYLKNTNTLHYKYTTDWKDRLLANKSLSDLPPFQTMLPWYIVFLHYFLPVHNFKIVKIVRELFSTLHVYFYQCCLISFVNCKKIRMNVNEFSGTFIRWEWI